MQIVVKISACKQNHLANIYSCLIMDACDVLFCPRLKPVCNLDPLLVIVAPAALKAD